MQLTKKKFIETSMYANKNIEKILREAIGESDNAVLFNLFEDKMILFDKNNNNFYWADYKLNAKDNSLVIENYEKIYFIEDNDDFVLDSQKYFSGDISLQELKASYAENKKDINAIFESELNEAMIYSNTSIFDNAIDDFYTIKEDLDLNYLKNQAFFKEYVDKMNEYPLSEIKHIDFKNKIKVSLINENYWVNSKAMKLNKKDYAKHLWKNDEFKKQFIDNINIFVEDVETGINLIGLLLKEHDEFFYLNNAEKKELIGKTLIAGNYSGSTKIKDLNEALIYSLYKYNVCDDKLLEDIDDDEIDDKFEINNKPNIDLMIESLNQIKEKSKNSNTIKFINESIDKLDLMKQNVIDHNIIVNLIDMLR